MDIIEKIADRVIYGNDINWNMNINSFDWVPGVGLHGIFQAYKATGELRYLDFLIKWTDKFLDNAYDKTTVNSTAPLLTVIDIYTITKNERYLKVCTDIADYIITKAPLTREGGLEHTVTEAVEGFSEQIWADTLFMVCIFLAKMGIIVDKKYSDFAARQLKIHLELLFDEEKGLYCHGWNCAEQNHMSAICWGRANAWIIYSSAEILNILGDMPEKEFITKYIKKHAESLIKFQRDDGSFGTIIDDADAYSETSAVGGIVAGIKKCQKLGILGSEFDVPCKKGIDFIISKINKEGEVTSVSTGTPVMPNAEAYKRIPANIPTLYGQALAICALA